MSSLSILWRFIRGVFSKVSAYLTGSGIIAIAWLYEHLSGKTIPVNIVLLGLCGFFVVGAFWVFREQYGAGRAIEIRNRLDGLVRHGESLRGKWLDNKHPSLRTKRWIRATRAFVKRNFTVTQLDAFATYVSETIHDEDMMDTRIHIAWDLQRKDPDGHALGSLIGKMLDGLRGLRGDIRD